MERILTAAKQCFAARGFAGTTIADIESAAGYTPRSGGIYRHFPSKVAVLEAVIDAELAANTSEILDEPAPDPAGADPRQVLEQVVRRGLAQLDRQADLMRIVFRDLDQFEHMLAKIRVGLTDATYRDFADRLTSDHKAGAIPELDFEAVAVLAIGPVVDFKIKQHLLGYTPLDLDQERLVHAWVHLFTTLLIGPQP